MWWKGDSKFQTVEYPSQDLLFCETCAFAFKDIFDIYWVPAHVIWRVLGHKNFMYRDDNVPSNVLEKISWGDFVPYQWSCQRKPQRSIGRVAAWIVFLVGICLFWSLCVSIADDLGDFLLLFLIFHRKLLLMFTITYIIMPESFYIPSEDCLAQRCLFCLYYFLEGILEGHRQISMRT